VVYQSSYFSQSVQKIFKCLMLIKIQRNGHSSILLIIKQSEHNPFGQKFNNAYQKPKYFACILIQTFHF
jgi:hypothetical protein